MTDIAALINKLNYWRGYSTPTAMGWEELKGDLARTVDALSRLSAPLPANTAEAVCHDEQLEIWADEFVEHLLAAECAPEFDSYEGKLTYFSAVKHAIKDLVGKAFEHPGLPKVTLSAPLPEEIAGLIEKLKEIAEIRTAPHRPKEDLPQWKAAAALRALVQENERWKDSAKGRKIERDAALRQNSMDIARIRELEADLRVLTTNIVAFRKLHEGRDTKAKGRIRELEAERDDMMKCVIEVKADRERIQSELDKAVVLYAYEKAAHGRALIERDAIRAKTIALLNKLDAIEADESFQGIWHFLHVHGYVYTGPDWKNEAEAIRALAQSEKGEEKE